MMLEGSAFLRLSSHYPVTGRGMGYSGVADPNMLPIGRQFKGAYYFKHYLKVILPGEKVKNGGIRLKTRDLEQKLRTSRSYQNARKFRSLSDLAWARSVNLKLPHLNHLLSSLNKREAGIC